MDGWARRLVRVRREIRCKGDMYMFLWGFVSCAGAFDFIDRSVSELVIEWAVETEVNFVFC